MPRTTYSVHFEPLENGRIHITVPLLPGCEATFSNFEKALDQAPARIETFLKRLAKAGKPIPTETLRPLCIPVKVKMPRVK